MRKIKLTKGKETLVDNKDYARLNKYKWYAQKWKYGYRVVRWQTFKDLGKRIIVSMPRQIMGICKEDKNVVDHINHNTLDNRRKNLRVCTQSENCLGRIH